MRFAKFLLASAASCAIAIAGSASAAVITFDSAPAGDGSNLTTPIAGATVIDFNSGSAPGTYSGDFGVHNTNQAGVRAAPAGDGTFYFTVPEQGNNDNTNTATWVSAGADFNYFGLYWGSIDAFNTLSFFDGAVLVETVTGTDVIAAGATLGDQISPGSNRYVNLFFGSDSFDTIVFNSTNFAFESDNHAFAQVPEPATLALLGAGLIGLGAARRRRR